MVYNEAESLGALLEALRSARGPYLDIRRIVVVSSGSTDHSVPVAERHAREDARITVIDDVGRRGKAVAINQFLDAVPAGIDLCVLCGADTLPSSDTLSALVAPFADPAVGLVGARPVPVNPRQGLVNRIVHFQWALHHEVSLAHPKMGELIAFRTGVPRIDPSTAVDEAWLEGAVTARGQRVVYAPDAVLHNSGPTHLRDFIAQRRRIWTGHYWLRHNTGHEVSTMRAGGLLEPTLRLLAREPRTIPVAVAAAATELFARALGTFDAVVMKRNPTIWERIDSSKGPINLSPSPRGGEGRGEG
jgi:poly-beta-1,6-N-acetyl-D-glucosamine synthase